MTHSIPSFQDDSTWHDRLHQIMAAQAANIARIRTGLVLESGATMVGPRPDLVRLHDQPVRIKQDFDEFRQAKLIYTIGPLTDDPEDRVMGVDGRRMIYMIVGLVSLSEDEQRQEQAERGTGHLLARRADEAIHDLKRVLRDNLHLKTDACRTGYVDDLAVAVRWDPEVQWPRIMFLVECTSRTMERDAE